MRRAVRWFARIVLGLAAFTILLLAITIGALHTDWGREQVRKRIVAQLQSSFPGGAEIERLDGSVFSSLIAHKIVLRGRDGKPMVTVENLTIDLALTPLLHKTARIESIKAERVVVHARKQPEPAHPPPPPPRKSSEPSTWSVEIPELRVRSATVVIETEHGSHTIEDLDATAALFMPAGRPLAAAVVASAKFRGRPIAVIAAVRNQEAIDVPFAIASYGDARVVAANVRIADGPIISGALTAYVPAALVKAFGSASGDLELPGDASIVASARPSGDIVLRGLVGRSELHVLANADLKKRSGRAIVAAVLPDVAAISRGKVSGEGTVVATVGGDENHAGGLISIVGSAEGNGGSALVLFDATREHATLLASVSGAPIAPKRRFKASRYSAVVSAELQGKDDHWNLVRSELVSNARDLEPMLGRLEAHLTASGPVYPARAVAIRGTVNGRGVVAKQASIARVRARIDALAENKRTSFNVQIDSHNIRKGAVVVPAATFAAHGARDGKGVIRIDLDRHRVRTADAKIWTGTGGHVTVTDDQITVDAVRTGTGKSQLTASATISRMSEDFTAKARARDVSLALVDPKLAGEVDGDVEVARRGGKWKGGATINAHEVALPKQPPAPGSPGPAAHPLAIDATLSVNVADRRITAHGNATNAKIGGATFDLDVIGPADITDPVAWKRVKRSSIKNIRIALSKIDANQLGASGIADGEVAISGTNTHGNVAVRGVQTSAGTVDSELVLAQDANGDIRADGNVQLAGLDPVTVDALLAMPQHPFDPAAWKQLGRGTLRKATIEAKHIAFDPALAKRFGVTTTARGSLAATINIGPAATTADVIVDVHDLTGVQLGKPVDIHVTGGLDASGIHAEASARADTVAVQLTAKTPLTLDAAIAGKARQTPVDVTVTVPNVSAREVGLLVRRNDVLGGVLGGTITFTGTIDKPSARAQLAVENLVIAAGISRKPPMLEKLALDARWFGDRAELELTGFESGGRVLKISARGSNPEDAVATIEAANFDLAPFAVFAPGQLAGARGIIGGVVKIKGFDPARGEVKGKLRITEGRFPISPEVGTLRDIDLDLTIKKQEIVALLSGRLGAGTIKGKAITRLTMGQPTAAELDLKLRRVSTSGVTQPIISADITGGFAAGPTKKWLGTLNVRNADVYVPPEAGSELLALGAPGDIIFVDKKRVAPKPARRPPRNPWLHAKIDIGRTKIKVEDTDFTFVGVASGQLKLAYGDGIGIDGEIATETGRVDVVGRRYRFDHGLVQFDGSLDPRLDLQMVHDFPKDGFTLTADIGGRASAPDLRLSGDPGTRSQSQLLAILMGGDPSEGDGGGAVAGGASAVFSSRLAKRLTKRLPIRLFDTFNYEAETISSSRAIKTGWQLNDDTYLFWRQRLEPRPDENPGEGVLEYQLSTSWLLEATGGQRGGGADIMWRWRH